MSWLKTHEERVVSDGRVPCPNSLTDVDVERCYSCTTDHVLTDADGDVPASVVCRGKPVRPVTLLDVIA